MPADAVTTIDVPSLDELDERIRAGLAGGTRVDSARVNEEVYQFRSIQYLEMREGEDPESFRRRPKRTTTIARGVVGKLSEPVYDPGPSRQLSGSAELDRWLQQVYAACQVDALLGEAEDAALLNHVAAIQVEATGQPDRPVRLWLWKAHQFEAFTRDGDPVNPWAVCTWDVVPAGFGKVRTRYRVWSALEMRTYLTAPYGGTEPATGRRADILDEAIPTPYPGVLPFAFVRAKPAATVSTFWEGGFGDPLVRLNLEMDRAESNLAEHVEEFLNPDRFVKNVPLGTQFYQRTGEYHLLRSNPALKVGDSNAQPDVFQLQAQLGVESARLDMERRCNTVIEQLGLPLQAVYGDASTDLSGVAIVAKMVPLVRRTRRRQRQCTEHEIDLAGKVLGVAGAWYGGWVLAKQATAAAKAPPLVVTWPEPQVPLPTPERDEADRYELEMGLSDPIEVLAKRRGVTIEQAETLAAEIAARRKRWAQLMGESAEPDAPGETGDAEPGDSPEEPSDGEEEGQG